MKKYVVYTAVVGTYDKIEPPAVVDDRFDYILFSNDIQPRAVSVWEVRSIPYFNEIPTKIARWVKTHPEELLSEYESSLWIDANILISSSAVYECYINHYKSETLVATMKHKLWDCVYDEMFSVLCCLFEHENVTLRWGHKLRREGYPQHNGLCETGVFYRRHADGRVKSFDQLWWECINKYSRRDQYSVNYSLWKKGLDYSYFVSESESVYKSSVFSHVEHEGQVPQLLKLGKYEAWLVRYYKKCPDRRGMICSIYYRVYAKRHPLFWAFLIGQYFRVKYLLKRTI